MTSKTANCCIRYMPERVVGVFDRAKAGKTVQDVLGFGGSLPGVGGFEGGLPLGATPLPIRIAPLGGRPPAARARLPGRRLRDRGRDLGWPAPLLAQHPRE